MSLATDMDAPLTEIMRVACTLASERPSLTARLVAAAQCLEQVREDIAAREHDPVPAHWREQRAASWDDLADGAVISLATERAARRSRGLQPQRGA